LTSFMNIWYTLWQFALFFGNLANSVVIYYIIPILVYCMKKNLATLLQHLVADIHFSEGVHYWSHSASIRFCNKDKVVLE
jgi:hypothetical protein